MVSAGVASFFVSPLITIIDKSVIRSANGSCPLFKGLTEGLSSLIFSPAQFLKRIEFRLIWLVYGCTYTANNCTETICINNRVDPFYYKFFITFVANMASSIYKDRRLTILFG